MKSRHDMITVFVVRSDEAGTSHEFLQLHRSPADYLGNTWQIVRGGVDAGESYPQAALRELREEAGLTPVEFFRLGSVEAFYTDLNDTLWHSIPFCAIVARNQSVLLNEEHDDYRWVSRAEIESLTMWASERPLLAELCRDILDDGLAKPYLRMKIEPAS
ncbi:MAG TPA: NUDIX domain-containing protein [Tepidisphaeraceae bacterium]|jgi:dATP pyrophosphohydrolase|nr:NUDIX domain-containing protein [Tepidisphaeraceae bacterium]